MLTIGLWDHVTTRRKCDVDIRTGIPGTMIPEYAPSDDDPKADMLLPTTTNKKSDCHADVVLTICGSRISIFESRAVG
eukprot:6284659-Pyramimonas_sp.AAC.1